MINRDIYILCYSCKGCVVLFTGTEELMKECPVCKKEILNPYARCPKETGTNTD